MLLWIEQLRESIRFKVNYESHGVSHAKKRKSTLLPQGIARRKAYGVNTLMCLRTTYKAAGLGPSAAKWKRGKSG